MAAQKPNAYKSVVGTDPSRWPGHRAAALGLAHAQLQQCRSPKGHLASALAAQEGRGPGRRSMGNRQEGNGHPAVARSLLQS